MTKEAIYDDKINPLMSQIISICKEHEIPMLADFALDWSDEDGSHLKCTTALLEGNDPPDEMLMAVRILRGAEPSPLMATVRDSDGNVKEMHAIV